jgi:hypothetical protein
MFKNGKILSLGEIDLTFNRPRLNALMGSLFLSQVRILFIFVKNHTINNAHG